MPFASGADPYLISGPGCARSRFSPLVRFAIFFGVLFAIRAMLPHTTLPVAAQVLALAAAATVLVWRLWWGCGAGRRGGVLLLSTFWLAALAKVIVQL